ncbi:hypothetical protein LI328DRAFT_126906 [Trichoderma asperelloides]|nr:hypothetical protein LI328DRAFT_126906 [Trichoderma asperelloides]
MGSTTFSAVDRHYQVGDAAWPQYIPINLSRPVASYLRCAGTISCRQHRLPEYVQVAGRWRFTSIDMVDGGY